MGLGSGGVGFISFGGVGFLWATGFGGGLGSSLDGIEYGIGFRLPKWLLQKSHSVIAIGIVTDYYGMVVSDWLFQNSHFKSLCLFWNA